MISLEKLQILKPLQKMPKNVRDLGNLIVAKCFKKLPQSAKNRPIWSHCSLQHWLFLGLWFQPRAHTFYTIVSSSNPAKVWAITMQKEWKYLSPLDSSDRMFQHALGILLINDNVANITTIFCCKLWNSIRSPGGVRSMQIDRYKRNSS